jgi:hypothetical protein
LVLAVSGTQAGARLPNSSTSGTTVHLTAGSTSIILLRLTGHLKHGKPLLQNQFCNPAQSRILQIIIQDINTSESGY